MRPGGASGSISVRLAELLRRGEGFVAPVGSLRVSGANHRVTCMPTSSFAQQVPLPDGLLPGMRLRRAHPDDAPQVFAYRGRPECQAYVSQTLTSVEDTRAMLKNRLTNADCVMWVIEESGRVIGDIGGRRFRPETLGPEPQEWDFYLGYVFHPDVWGQGLATSAVAAFVPQLQAAGIRRVTAKVLGPNEGSIRVLLKNGFSLEGCERAAVLGRDGTWLDDHLLVHRRSS